MIKRTFFFHNDRYDHLTKYWLPESPYVLRYPESFTLPSSGPAVRCKPWLWCALQQIFTNFPKRFLPLYFVGGGNTFLRNAGTHPLKYMKLDPRRLWYWEILPSWKDILTKLTEDFEDDERWVSWNLEGGGSGQTLSEFTRNEGRTPWKTPVKITGNFTEIWNAYLPNTPNYTYPTWLYSLFSKINSFNS
jgi:hypothetical protein